ncbi:hypothetical protein ABZU75_40625 [Streptosporangium sp. NPDC005286]
MLGPGAAWVLEHFDGVRGLDDKDLVAARQARSSAWSGWCSSA